MLGLSLGIAGLSQCVTGLFNSFPILCGMRVLHGAMNAALSPLSYSLVSDYVPPEKRATANSILGIAIYAGISLSSLSILLIRSYGWRWSYQFMGAAGILVGLIMALLIKEPKNGKKMYPFIDTSDVTRQKDHDQSTKKDSEDQNKSGIRGFFSNLKRTLTLVIENPTSRYVTLAAIMRTFGGISVATYLPIYFLKVFPAYRNQYAVINAASLAIGGLISSLAGGIIADRFESKSLMTKSYVCIVSSLMAFPLTALSCLGFGNFWFAITAISLKTLLSASFTSPAMTMMQNTTRTKDQGSIISAHMFYQTIAATICPILFSKVGMLMGASSNPMIYGKLVAVFSLAGYWGSIPFWWLAGKSYKKHMEQRQK